MTDNNFTPILEKFFDIPGPLSEEDKLFTSCSEDWWNDSLLNHFQDGWDRYVFGYKEAADIIVSCIQERNDSSQDFLIYPVVFLYRQYIELAIKNLIKRACDLEDMDQAFSRTHRIDELWKFCHKLLNQILRDNSNETLNQIDRLIKEFCKVDPLSMAFRYPEDKHGNPFLRGVTRISLPNVKNVINKISVVLEGAYIQIEEYSSIKADLYSEIYDYL